MDDKPRPPLGSAPEYLLEGRYLAEGTLALGEVAEVFKGTDTWSGEQIAIRRLRADRRDKDALFRRMNERLFGATSARLVRAIHMGEDRDGYPFLVTELLVGRDVEKLGKVRWEVACEVTRQASQVIAEMHLNGLFHGSLTPSSLFVATSNAGGSRVKLLGLGTGERSATASKDVRSLVGILHRLLLGMPPLPTKARTAKVRIAIPGVPPLMEETLEKWLAAEGEGFTAQDMADELKALVDASHELPRSGPELPGPRVVPKTSMIVFDGEDDPPSDG